MNDKLRPALIGGVVLGVLSVVPVVNLGTCCCLWELLGGALATYLYIKSSTKPVSIGEGAMLGALAGVVGGLIYVIIGVPINIITGNAAAGLLIDFVQKLNPEQAEQVRRQLEAQSSMPFTEQLLMLLPRALFVFVFIFIIATIGGLIAVPIFEKRSSGPTAPPAPPPNFGPQGGI